MITLRQFVYYSTALGVFSSGFMYEAGTVRIMYFYAVMVLNLGLMAYLGKIWCPSGLGWVTLFVAASGLIGVAQGTDTVWLSMKELLGIFFAGLYFCSVVQMVDFDVARCFRTYANTAFYVAIFGIVLFPFQAKLGLRDPNRLRSALSEPADFAAVCLPAFYYYADRWQRGERVGRRVLVFAAAYILAGSSTGFIGIIFGAYIFCRRFRRGAFLMPFVILIVGSGIYAGSADFRLRLDDAAGYLAGSDYNDNNLSVFVLASSLHVAARMLAEHPLVGGGVGSQFVSHERFVDELVGFDRAIAGGFRDLNSHDGNSLLLRCVSETGLVGVGLLFWTIWRFRPRADGESMAVGNAIQIYIFVALVRIGTYVSIEEVFFLVVYVVNALPLGRRDFASARDSGPSVVVGSGAASAYPEELASRGPTGREFGAVPLGVTLCKSPATNGKSASPRTPPPTRRWSAILWSAR